MPVAHSKKRSFARTLNVWGRVGGHAAGRLRAGSDVVLEVSLADALALPQDVALDDCLRSDMRLLVDGECREGYRRWRERYASALTVEGVDLTHIWEVELIAQCFLPAACIRRALPLAFEHSGCTDVVTRQLEPGPARLLAAVAAARGVGVRADRNAPAPRARLRRAPSPLGLAAARCGVRPHVRGELLSVPYWNTLPLLAELAAGAGLPRVVSCPLPIRTIGTRRALTLTARGGWTGLPGPRERARSRATLLARLRGLDVRESSDPFEAALDRFALETLERLSLETLAHVRHTRRALARGRVRVGLLPFDGAEQARMLFPGLRESGARTLVVQHGFSGRLGDPEMLVADHLAVWSQRDRSYPPGRDPATITVTGNPGVTHLAGGAPARRAGRGRSVVIVDYGGRLSVGLDRRIHGRHVRVALRALAAARPGTTVIVRPHPSDLVPDGYEALAAEHPRIRVHVDTSTPIEALFADVDLCVGAVSTATLQGSALGVPTVVLDVSGRARPWPFHASSLPCAEDAGGLAAEIDRALRRGEVAGRAEALEALGVRADAIERVIELIGALSR